MAKNNILKLTKKFNHQKKEKKRYKLQVNKKRLNNLEKVRKLKILA